MSRFKNLEGHIMSLSDVEHEIGNFYDYLWSDPGKIKRSGKGLFLGWHYGFYEKGIKNINEAMINMNNYLGRLLELDDKTGLNILDAGSGVGSTSIYLAKIYPNCFFNGIDLTAVEVKIAELSRKKQKVENVKFKHASYMDSGFPDNHFDRIFALESTVYAPNKKKFLNEMYRLLKPNGKLVIIDTFPKKLIINSMRVNTYSYFHQKKFTKEHLENYYGSIGTFTNHLKSEKFREINVKDIVDSGNVKRSHIYAFLISLMYPYLVSYLREIRKNRNPVIYGLISPFLFLIFYVYRILLLFSVKPSYFSIEAKK